MSEYKILKSYSELSVQSAIESAVSNTFSKLIFPLEPCGPCEVGFGGSQKPYEFYSAWNSIGEILLNEEVPTFLEIGAAYGLWAIAFIEWCKLNKKVGEYYTVTWMQHNEPVNGKLFNVQKYYDENGYKFKLFDASSQLSSTKEEVIKERPNFSLVFIDADHRYDGVKKDIELYVPLATKVLGFHDIGPRQVCPEIGVYQAILDSNMTLSKEFRCDDNHMGIGLKLI